MAEPEGDSRGHETRDMSFRAVATFGIGLVVFTVLVLVLMRWWFGYLAASAARADRAPSPMAAIGQLPPEPRLQIAPAEDLLALRAAEEKRLKSYGWADRKAGIVHIPIDRAMDALVERATQAKGRSEGAK